MSFSRSLQSRYSHVGGSFNGPDPDIRVSLSVYHSNPTVMILTNLPGRSKPRCLDSKMGAMTVPNIGSLCGVSLGLGSTLASSQGCTYAHYTSLTRTKMACGQTKEEHSEEVGKGQ